MNFGSTLKYLFSHNSRQKQSYITNDKGDFLAHPDATKAFAFEFGRTYRIQTSHPQLRDFLRRDNREDEFTGRLVTQNSDLVIDIHKIRFDPFNPDRYLAIIQKANYADVVAESVALRNRSILLTLLLIVGSGILAFFFSSRITRPLANIIAAAKAYAKGSRDFTLPLSTSGEIGNLAQTFDDMIQQREQAQEALRDSEKDWRRTFDSVSDFVSLLDNDMRIIRANKALADFVGTTPEELIGRHCYDVFNCPDTIKTSCAYSKTRKMKESVTEEIDDPQLHVPIEVTTSPVFDNKGEIAATVHIAKDITERKRTEERLQYLAHHDSLTKLPNNTLLIDRLDQALARARWHKRLVAVLFLDLDRFKVINDTMGHDIGDQLLKSVADRLLGTVREGDTVSRLGGDEFTIILADVAETSDVTRVVKTIMKVMEKPFELQGGEYFATSSIGISLHPDHADNSKELITYADIAMYYAKEQGRNNYQFYSSTMDAQAPDRLALETKLRHALEREEFLLHYQPIIDLSTGRITGMEALLRWQPHGSELISPIEFIPLLEETGMITIVGEWVLNTACQQNKSWQDQGLPNLRVAVNLSARQFKLQNLVEIVTRALEAADLEARYLELELTESILMEQLEGTMATLKELNAMGIHISIDDFGTGYSSLSYLKRFPINSLKIDRSFIRDIMNDQDDAILTKTIIAMAHNLSITVIAEGVENQEQLALLNKNRCDKMQGYYFSRPLPVEAFTLLLEEGRHLDVDQIISGGSKKQGTE